MNSPLLVYVTFPSLDEAKTLVKGALDERLIACANIQSPGLSLYRWQSELIEETEVYAILKTNPKLFSALESYIVKHHSYSTPCVISLQSNHCSSDYTRWLDEQVS